MDNKVVDYLRSIASDFSYLADELERQQEATEAKINDIESEVMSNREALKDAANAILGRLG